MIRKLARRFNRWYDAQVEPLRFLIFMGLISWCPVVMTLDSPALMVATYAYLGVLIAARAWG